MVFESGCKEKQDGFNRKILNPQKAKSQASPSKGGAGQPFQSLPPKGHFPEKFTSCRAGFRFTMIAKNSGCSYSRSVEQS